MSRTMPKLEILMLMPCHTTTPWILGALCSRFFPFHSLWDLASFNMRDTLAQARAAEMLSLSVVQEFRDKTLEYIRLVRDLWPDARRFYRLQQGVRGSAGDWYMRGLPNESELRHIAREPMGHNKINQFNEVIRQILDAGEEGRGGEERERGSWRAAWRLDGSRRLRAFDMAHVLQDHTGDCKCATCVTQHLYLCRGTRQARRSVCFYGFD